MYDEECNEHVPTVSYLHLMGHNTVIELLIVTAVGVVGDNEVLGVQMCKHLNEIEHWALMLRCFFWMTIMIRCFLFG